MLAALDGEEVVRSRSGERVMKSDNFFVTVLTTALQPNEMVTEVRSPTVRPEAGRAFVEFRRCHGAFAIVGAAAVADLDAVLVTGINPIASLAGAD